MSDYYFVDIDERLAQFRREAGIFLANWAAGMRAAAARSAPAPLPPALLPPLPPALPAFAPQQQQQHQQPLPPPQHVPAAPAVQGAPAAQPQWAWLAQHVPNRTGTYYTYKAQPGVSNSPLADAGPGQDVLGAGMVSLAFEQVKEKTLVNQGEEALDGLIAAMGGMPAAGNGCAPTKAAKARWMLAREAPLFAPAPESGAVPAGFLAGRPVAPEWSLGSFVGGVLVLAPSTEDAVRA